MLILGHVADCSRFRVKLNKLKNTSITTYFISVSNHCSRSNIAVLTKYYLLLSTENCMSHFHRYPTTDGLPFIKGCLRGMRIYGEVHT